MEKDKKETKELSPKTDNKKQPDREENPRYKKIRCCLIAGVVLFVLIIIVVSCRSRSGSKADIDISKYLSPTPSSYIPATNTPDSGQTGAQDQNPSETTSQDQPQDDSTTQPTPNRMMDFFVEIALKDMDKQHDLALCRWTKNPVTISVVEGSLDATYSNELNSFISDFNSASPIKLQIGGGADIKIYVISPDRIYFYSNSRVEEGYYEGNNGDNCTKIEGRVYVSNADINADLKKYVIRHEMTHAIGFPGHSDIYSDSIMTVGREGYTFSEHDRQAIQMLYNPSLPLCSREAQVREFFK